MTRIWFSLFLPVVLFAYPVTGAAQSAAPPSTRAEEHEREQQEKAKHTHPYVPGFMERQILRFEEEGGFTTVRGVSPTFGGIKRGSGFAMGPAVGHTFSDGSIAQAKAVFSIRNYKLLQGFYQAKPFADGHLLVNGRVRWQEAPKGAVFAIGPQSPNARAAYDEQRTEVSAQALAHPISFIRLGGGGGWEKYRTSDVGIAGVPQDEALSIVPPLPGVSADPKYVHTYGMAALDWRESPGYSRRGTLLQAAAHDFRALDGQPYSFHRVDGVVQQLIPILRGNIVFDLSARVWSTSPDRGDQVPFFLMPSLGGSDFLRGFHNYRFRDRHAMVLTGQYRWYAQEYLDGVLFYEAGKVAPTLGDLDLSGLKKSYGIGFHFHTSTSTLLRFEVARSREDLRFILGFTPLSF